MEPPSTPEGPPGQEGPNEQSILVKGLQDTALAAIEQLRSSERLTQTWSLPARVFPQSVVILAACLISGSEADVRTIQLNIAIPSIGRPQSSLNALLEYCSVLGRKAFEKSDEGMLEIGSLASSAQKRVERIMGLVGRPERHALLQAELKDFQDLASNLKNTVNVISTAFEEWSEFTDDLRIHIRDEQGTALGEAIPDEDLKLVQDIFNRSEQKLEKAQAHYDEQDKKLASLLTAGVPKVSSPMEVLERLSEIIPRDSDKWPGLRRIWRVLCRGEKRTEKTFDDRLKMHMENFTEVIKVSAAEAERQKPALREQIEVASTRLKNAEADLNAARQEYAAASENLMRASRTVSQRSLKLLAESKLDLKEIQNILGVSTQQLKLLRQQISNLSTLFTDLANVIKNTVYRYEALQRGLGMGKLNDVHQAMEFTRDEKADLLSDVYEISGRLTTVSHVSQMYVLIYRQYIRPGLDSMENLSRTNIDLYRKEYRELEAWCAESTGEIEQLTLESLDKIPVDIEGSIRSVLANAMRRCQFWAGE